MMMAESTMTATEHTFLDHSHYSHDPATAVSKQDEDVELRFDEEEEMEMELTVSRPATFDEATMHQQQLY